MEQIHFKQIKLGNIESREMETKSLCHNTFRNNCSLSLLQRGGLVDWSGQEREHDEKHTHGLSRIWKNETETQITVFILQLLKYVIKYM